jgi:hypothetical protein
VRALLTTLLLFTGIPLSSPAASSSTSTAPSDLVAVVAYAGTLHVIPLDGSTAVPPGTVLAVSKNPRAYTIGSSLFAPSDDPRSHEQWGLRAVGAKAAWERSTGKEIVVAVLDTGVAPHEDLPGLLPGRSFIGATEPDPNGHGTHVAGIIAAAMGNGLGIAGLAPAVRLLPVQVLDAEGSGDHADIASGIIWATDNGADVINLSLGGEESSDVLSAAVQYAVSKDVIVVAAAGNSGSGSNAPMYPAAYDPVLAVAAAGPDGTAAMFSNSGPYVDLAAPGFAILSTVPGGYDYLSGTSQAAPFVSAAAALLLGAGRAPAEISNILATSSRDVLPTGRDPYTGAGMLDVAAALGAPPTGATPVPSLPERLPNLPAIPELPTLRPPSLDVPTMAPLVSIIAPERLRYGSMFEVTVLVANCRKCALHVDAPRNQTQMITAPERSGVVKVRLRATVSGTVRVATSDGVTLASTKYVVESSIEMSKPVSARGSVTIRGIVRPGRTTVSLERLEQGAWRSLASRHSTDGSFVFQVRRSKPGVYRIAASDGAVSRPFAA